MKTASALSIALLCACASGPQTAPEPADPKAAPPPTPAPPAPPPDPAPIVDGDVTVGWFHGMQIIVKRVPGADFVAGRLFIRGGVRNWDAQDAGLERLALISAASGGTRTLDKDAFATRLAEMGSTVDANTGNDYSVFAAKALRPSWDDTFALMMDAFLHPAMPKGEFELQRQRQLSALKHEQESPDGQLRLIVHETLYKRHPYEHRAIGTIENTKSFTVEQAVKYLPKLKETTRYIWVVVGDVDAPHVIDQAGKAFAEVPRGDYQETPLPEVKFDRSNLVAIERKLPTNYIEGAFIGPKDSSPDAPATIVASSVLSWRLFQEVRTKRNLSYAAAAGLNTRSELPVGFVYTTAVQPNETVKVIRDEIQKIRTEPVPEKELLGDKAVFLTSFYMENESTDGQAQLLGGAQIHWGTWKLARTIPEKIKAVTAANVQAAAKKYLDKFQTVAIGAAPEQLDKDLFNSL